VDGQGAEVVYVYAIAEPRHAPPAGPGLEGEPVGVVVAGDLMAVVSECQGPEVVASEDALWIHETVVEQLMAEGTVLPLRFGTVLPDDAAVRSMLATDHDELLDGLQRVRDAVEVAVHVTWEPEQDASDPSGTAYLVDRLGRTRRAMEFAERMDTVLAELARASKRQVGTTPALVLTCAYLVDRARMEEFRERVQALGGELDHANIVCTGPWPPYSFAGAEET
jgi:hypothetical protein